ncbi:hypothetical protein JCM5350_005031 [Sporobolomyces pararoseus]
MAGANSKRIATENAKQLTLLRAGTAITSVIYILHLFLFQSGRTKWRVFLFVATLTSELSTWQQLEMMASRGQAIFEGKGLIQYMFDLIYITWFVHVTTALVSTKFWYLFWIIPGYGLYKLSNFFFPNLLSSITGSSPSSSSSSSSRTGNNGIAAPAAGAQDGVTSEIMSKRQEKLRKRVEKGDPRAIAKNQEKQLLQQKIEKQNAAKNKNQD